MQIFKFGGASINSIERIQNVAYITERYNDEQLVIVVSAIGKTTNALEKVVEMFYNSNNEQALQLFINIKEQHIATAKQLLVKQYNTCISQLSNFFTEAEWLLHDKPVHSFDYYYDQIVCIGELLSSCIISHYFNEENIKNEWIDVRDIIRTDNNFRDAVVDWQVTEKRIKEFVADKFKKANVVITQGFIGATDENESTTLGREGSDYSAAVFANVLDAATLTIWKDVVGVMNADPKQFSNAQLLPNLSYNEVIEMAYYGAQVIHPKTIKPLQNKNITLYVKCFLDSDLPGTVISNIRTKNLPPIIVTKKNQTVLTFTTQDFSFVGEKPVSQLYKLLEELKIKPNILQTGAISIEICLDEHPEKIQQLASLAGQLFDIQVEKGLSLLTIRHFTDEILSKMTDGKEKILLQQTKETVQIVIK